MRTVLGAIVALILTVFAGRAGGQDINNPGRFLDRGKLSMGLRASWLFEQSSKDAVQHFTCGGAEFDSRPVRVTISDDQIYMFAVNYGILSRLNAYAEFGFADGGTFKQSHPGAERWKADMDTRFAWAIGLKGKLLEVQTGPSLIAAAQYMQYRDRSFGAWQVSNSTDEKGAFFPSDAEMSYWQADTVVAVYWPLGEMAPYVGATFSYSEGRYEDRETAELDGATLMADTGYTFKNMDLFGAVLGLDATILDNFIGNIQGNFFNRYSVSANLAYQF